MSLFKDKFLIKDLAKKTGRASGNACPCLTKFILGENARSSEVSSEKRKSVHSTMLFSLGCAIFPGQFLAILLNYLPRELAVGGAKVLVKGCLPLLENI